MSGKIHSYWLAALFATVLAACGGGGGGSNGGCATIDPNRDPNLPGCGTTTPVTGKAAVTLTLSSAAITPAATTTATAILKDANGAVVANTLVTFTSTDNNAVLTPASGGVVTDGAGKATIQVGAGAATTAGGYALTASATVAAVQVTASAGYSFSLPAAIAGQLSFVSALPRNIALKGTGGAGRQESSIVTFKVLDAGGNPVAGQQVNFTLDTSAGGLTLSPASAVTGGGGLATTTVSSGTVNTPVRVTATLASGIATLSDQLVVSTGVAEQNSFSLGAAVKNIEGGQFNGCTAPTGTVITARLADHFHNPVPDGTAVSFTAEGGSIDASCLTGLITTTLPDGTIRTEKGSPGECTVRYCAGNPRPADGRVTILAYALGEESFADANGNNRYDAGETYTDLGDPFRNDRAVSDANANGIDDAFRSGSAARAVNEQYIDSNGNGAWDQNGNGAYNGVLLATPNVNTGAANTVHVRQSMVLVLSNSSPAVTLLDQASAAGAPIVGTLALARCVDGTRFVNDTRSFNFAIRDSNPTVFATNLRSAHPGDAAWLFDRPGNPLPAGTTIQFSTSNGTILGGNTTTVQNTNAADSSAWTYSVSMTSDASQGASLICTNAVSGGALLITVTTPNGTVSTFSYPVSD
jgi:hypothetical protein